jgi:hypothetical protein
MPAEDTNPATPESTASQALITPPPPIPAELQAMARRESQEPFGPRHIWYTAYGSDYKWARVVRDGQQGGHFGEGSRIEAVQIMVVGTPGIMLCAYMERWGDWVWAAEGNFERVGRPGDSLRMEALSLSVADGEICGTAYVQDEGFHVKRCARGPDIAMIGTTGQGLGMGALMLEVRD